MPNEKNNPESVKPQKTERDFKAEIEAAKQKQASEQPKSETQDELIAKLTVAQEREKTIKPDTPKVEEPVPEEPPKDEPSDEAEEIISKLEQQRTVNEIEDELKKFAGYADITAQSTLTNMTNEEIGRWLEEEIRGMPAEEQRRVLSDTDSLVFRLLRTNNNPSNSNQAEMMIRALDEVAKTNRKLVCSIDTVLKDKSTSGGRFSNELHGNKAALAFTARMKGLKKVYLYNSGFHIDIRPFELAELNEFFMSIDNEGQELGRILGGHFYMVHDLFVKQKFMEILPLAIVGSNLKGWDRGDILAKNISINDYDTLMWAVCSLMYNKGVRVDMVCGDTSCGHTTRNILHDIQKMRMVDTENMGEEAIEWLVSGKEVTSKDLQHYRTEILGQTSTFTDKQIRFHLRVPSIFDVLDYGNKLMSIITAKVQGSHTLKNDQIVSRVLINYNRSFVPWISRIDMMNEDDSSKVDFTSTSHEAFHSVLEVRVDDPDDGTILTNITEFMRSTKLCHICYPATPCGACGKLHPHAVDGMLAWDAQYLFFSLTYRKLEPIGIV